MVATNAGAPALAESTATNWRGLADGTMRSPIATNKQRQGGHARDERRDPPSAHRALERDDVRGLGGRAGAGARRSGLARNSVRVTHRGSASMSVIIG